MQAPAVWVAKQTQENVVNLPLEVEVAAHCFSVTACNLEDAGPRARFPSHKKLHQPKDVVRTDAQVSRATSSARKISSMLLQKTVATFSTWVRHVSQSPSEEFEIFNQQLCGHLAWPWQERALEGWAADAVGGSRFLNQKRCHVPSAWKPLHTWNQVLPCTATEGSCVPWKR